MGNFTSIKKTEGQEVNARQGIEEDYLFVVAIDIGTTYSGYSFSARDEYKTNPNSQRLRQWTDPSNNHVSNKTSTCILFDPKGEFHSFGFEAEEKFYNLAEDNKHADWYYFKSFKMQLYKKNLDDLRELQLTAENGKTMYALNVFSQSIRYLKDAFLRQNNDAGFNWEEQDIRWVLTVPAIWPEEAISFMRKAAEEAGIVEQHLKICLEPEAATIFTYESNQNLFHPGCKFIVVDAGGGTVDVTGYEVLKEKGLKELFPPSGGDWGGNRVNKAFLSLLGDIFGTDILSYFRRSHASEYHELGKSIEISKGVVMASDDVTDFTLKIPSALWEIHRQHSKNRKENDKISLEKDGKTYIIKLRADKIRFSRKLAKLCFEQPISSIVKHLKSLLNSSDGQGVELIVMAGGFSNSMILLNTVKKAFPKVHVVTPHFQEGDAAWSVLRGAVNFGHGSNLIDYRRCKRTYGFEITEQYDVTKHASHRPIRVNGEDRCYEVFKKIVEKNKPLKANETRTETVGIEPDWDGNLKFFASDKKNPVFTDEESSWKIGKIHVDKPFPKSSNLEIKMFFGKGEIEFDVTNPDNGKKIRKRLVLDI